MEIVQMAKIAAALADPTRLRIFSAIARKREMNCGEVTCQYGLTPGTVSHHLRTLAEAGLIESRREGQFIYNRAIPGALRGYAEQLKRLAAPGLPRARKRLKRG
jgi:ArsR family transcriptional regulator, arsenate/arsenite/antimonite-responsive transcriptional repressor